MTFRHLRVVPPPADDIAKPKRRAVENGELVYTSVSQIQKFGECPSRWYFRYVLGLPDAPPGKGQQRGTEGHGRVEQYLKSGIDTLDNLERRGKKFMPAPNMIEGKPTPEALADGPVLIEEGFKAPSVDADQRIGNTPLYAEGVPLVGYIDLVDPRDMLRNGGVLRVKDWKFKKSIDLYGAAPEDLINPSNEAGKQMIGYAQWATQHFARADVVERYGKLTEIELSHVTFQTYGLPDVQQVTAPIRVDSVAPLWETVTHAAIPGMRKAAAATHFAQVPRNERVCHKYGKACPYISTCLDRMARVRAGFRSKTSTAVAAVAAPPQTKEALMSLLGKMVHGSPGPSAAPVSHVPIQSGSASPPSPPDNKPFYVDKSTTPDRPVQQAPSSHVLTAEKAQQGQDYKIDGIAYRFLCFTSLGGDHFASFMPLAGGKPNLVAWNTPIEALALPIIVPPDAPKSDPKLASEPLPAPVVAQVTVSPPATAAPEGISPAQAHAELNAIATAVASGGAVPPAPQAADKPKRGRPRKDTSANIPAAGAANAPGLSAEVAENQATPDGTPYGNMTGVHLYFGCSPIGVSVTQLGTYVNNLERELMQAAQLNIADLRIASDNVFGFGKWKGFLAKAAQEQTPPPGHYVVMSSGDERVSCVADALAQIAEPGCVVAS